MHIEIKKLSFEISDFCPKKHWYWNKMKKVIL